MDENKERWMDDMLTILAEDVRETKLLTKAVRKETKVAQQIAEEAKRQADAAWELVVITRNEYRDFQQYMLRPWWKKLIGLR